MVSSAKVAATTMLTSAMALIPLLPNAELIGSIKKRMSAECTDVSLPTNNPQTTIWFY